MSADEARDPPAAAPGPPDLRRDGLLAGCAWTERGGVRRPSIGSVELHARIGEGGMGVVYRGFHTRLETEVAVKLLPPRHDAAADAHVARFLREARTAARVRSDHLVGVFDVGRDESSGNHYFVMEHVRGPTAAQWAREAAAADGRVAERDALDVIAAAARGLAAAHAAGVVHRDVKPDNILLPSGADGRPMLRAAKLADLGIARLTEGAGTLTAEATAMGTPGYMAPEQARDARTAGKPADVFSLGATLYSLLAGEAPFSAETPVAAILLTIQSPHAPIRAVRPDVSVATAELLDRCLAKDPAARPADAGAFLAEVGAGRPQTGSAAASVSLAPSGAAPAAASEAPARPPRTSATSRRIAAGAGAVAALAAAVAYIVRRADAPTEEHLRAARAVLADCAAWDAAPAAAQSAAARLVAELERAFEFDGLREFACGGVTRRIAVFRHAGTGLEFSLVPGGSFTAGSPESEPGRRADEATAEIRLTAPILVARTECTQESFQRVTGRNPSRAARLPTVPVDSVVWGDAVAYCDAAGLSLPTEAEWEYACRAGTTTAWACGNDEDGLIGHGWFFRNSGRAVLPATEPWQGELVVSLHGCGPHPVGQLQPNAFGLFDMHGNVAEWCADWYGSARPASSADPTGPGGGIQRVLRGGSWYYSAAGARSARRSGLDPSQAGESTSFRPVRRVRLP